MKALEFGQFLWMVTRFNNDGMVSKTVHPYMVFRINEPFGYVEAIQFDSLEGKEYRVASEKYKVVFNSDPKERVLYKDSFAVLDYTFRFELFDDLKRFRMTPEKLSFEKRMQVQTAYESYHRKHNIPESHKIYMSKEEIMELNPIGLVL